MSLESSGWAESEATTGQKQYIDDSIKEEQHFRHMVERFFDPESQFNESGYDGPRPFHHAGSIQQRPKPAMSMLQRGEDYDVFEWTISEPSVFTASAPGWMYRLSGVSILRQK